MTATMQKFRDLVNLQDLLKRLPEGGTWRYEHEKIESSSFQVNWSAILTMALELAQEAYRLETRVEDLESRSTEK